MKAGIWNPDKQLLKNALYMHITHAVYKIITKTLCYWQENEEVQNGSEGSCT